MKEENKKSKKKVLLTYLILAACLLVIAAVTVTVVLTVNRNPDLSIDNPNHTEEPDDGKPDDTNKEDPDKDKPSTPTDNETGYKIPVESAVVSTRYEFAHNETIEQYRVHQGLDFEGSVGDSVCCVLDGTVTEVVTGSHIGENYVTISHANGVTSTYKYIDAKNGLKKGDKVKRGEIIGTIASAGGYEMKQGEHLHFEMSVNGKSADPETYLDLVEK